MLVSFWVLSLKPTTVAVKNQDNFLKATDWYVEAVKQVFQMPLANDTFFLELLTSCSMLHPHSTSGFDFSFWGCQTMVAG